MGLSKVARLVTLFAVLAAIITPLVSASRRYHGHKHVHTYEDEEDCVVGEQRCNGLNKFDTCAPGGFWETQDCPFPLFCIPIPGGAIMCDWK